MRPERGKIQMLRSHHRYSRLDDKVAHTSTVELVMAASSCYHFMCDKKWVEALVGAFPFFVIPSDPFRALTTPAAPRLH